MLCEKFFFLESKAILDYYKTLIKLCIRKKKREKIWNLLYFNIERYKFEDVYVFIIFDLVNDNLIWFSRKNTQMKNIYLDFMKMYRSNFIKENLKMLPLYIYTLGSF